MNEATHGLVLGKFCPFHRGHRLLVDTARAECEKVTVVVYDWPAYRIYSSEFYGAHIARSLGAVDRRVDAARRAVPISGTRIREDAFACRAFIPPVVYRDLVCKVVFMGSISTGKSTIARALAEKYGTTFMDEYGAEYWREHSVNRRIRPEELEYVAEEHLRREEARICEANRFCFIDTNAITTYMFSLDYHGRATPRLAELAAACKDRYDVFFLCKDDIPYEDTPDRSGDVKRHAFQRQIEDDLAQRGIPAIPLYGSLDARLARVAAELQAR